MPSDKQRRAAERRKVARQEVRRDRQDAKRRQATLVSSIVGALVVIGLIVFFIVQTSSDHSTPQPRTTPEAAATSSTAPSSATSSAATASYPCTWTTSGTAARKVNVPPTTRPPRSGAISATLTTSRGVIAISLDRAAAPCAVESFVSLIRQGYYDHTPCHRLTATSSLSVLQCGDPTGTGTGGPGYVFGNEVTGKEQYTTGVVAMANTGAPDSNGSQFFIVYKDSTLPPSYTIFGHVTKGLNVVDAVAAKGETPNSDGKPNLPISIDSVSTSEVRIAG